MRDAEPITRPDETERLLAEVRPVAFAVAYRMLGSVTEAEDVAQDALARLHAQPAGSIDNPAAWTTTTAGRLALDVLRSARARREQYVGPWLPEPLIGGAEPVDLSADDPAAAAELADSLSTAFLVVLETLSPLERAVFLLHDVFDRSYAEVAEVVGRSEAACRQLASRARRHVAERRPRFDASEAERAELARRFFEAAGAQDREGMEALLDPDVVMIGDGGGKVPSAPRPLHGAPLIANFFAKLAGTGARTGVEVEPALINGQPGVLGRDAGGGLINAVALIIEGGRIVAVHSITNPDKLAHLGRVGDLRALLRGVSGKEPS